jgi:hypothetical protein
MKPPPELLRVRGNVGWEAIEQPSNPADGGHQIVPPLALQGVHRSDTPKHLRQGDRRT